MASIDKLGKVLALADSSHDGEALAALRTARSLLKDSGMDLSDVLSQVLEAGVARPKIPGSPQLEALYLRRLLQDREKELDFWKKEAETAKAAFAHSEKERERWQKLAKDTMEKLWAIAKDIRKEER